MAVASCTVPIGSGLDEDQANRVIVALDRVAIEGAKELDPGVEGKFRISVLRDDLPRALEALHSEGLPQPRPKGIAEVAGRSSLVPSPGAEHAQLLAGLAGELERSLLALDGTLSARVHLHVPVQDPLAPPTAGEKPAKATASVLLEHRGTTPPISVDAVQRLVAGGVGNLAPYDVSVITVARAVPVESAPPMLTHIGPIAVARRSAGLLQAGLTLLVLLAATFAGTTLWFYARLRRLGTATPSPPSDTQR